MHPSLGYRRNIIVFGCGLSWMHKVWHSECIMIRIRSCRPCSDDKCLEEVVERLIQVIANLSPPGTWRYEHVQRCFAASIMNATTLTTSATQYVLHHLSFPTCISPVPWLLGSSFGGVEHSKISDDDVSTRLVRASTTLKGKIQLGIKPFEMTMKTALRKTVNNWALLLKSSTNYLL